jgi:hypothetical protein
MWRALLLLLVVGIAATAQATPVQVTGRVLVEGGAPAATTVTCTAAGEASLSPPEPVDLAGRYSLSMESGDASHVRCEASAKGFKPGVVTGLIVDGKARLDTILLNLATTLRVEAVRKQLLSPAEAATGVAVLLVNQGASEVPVAERSISATAHETTSCFDPRPTLVFDFAPKLPFELTVASERVATGKVEWPQGNWRESVSAAIKLEKMGCRQQRLLIRIPYAFNVPGKSNVWLRFKLPARIAVRDGPAVEVALFDWDDIQADVGLADGTHVSRAGSR